MIYIWVNINQKLNRNKILKKNENQKNNNQKNMEKLKLRNIIIGINKSFY